MKKQLNKKVIKWTSLAAAFTSLLTTNACAANLAGSQLGSGITKMINDAANYLTVLGPVVACVAAIYFFIRRSMADEQDGKTWNRRIIVSIICGVAVALVSGIISLVSSYF